MRQIRHRWVGIALGLATWPLLARSGPAQNDPRFGVMTHFAHGWDPELIALVAESGVGTIRDELYWSDLEPEKGSFVLPDRHERMMTGLARHHLEPLVVLSFGNEAYDDGATPHSDEGNAAFARYAVQLLRHHGQQIKAVEVWNEYNGSFVRGPAADDRAASYLRMLRRVYEEVKRERPDVKVVGGGTAGIPLPYWEKLLAGGALGFMDVLSVHPYRYDAPPEGLETDIAELQALVAKHSGGRPAPIWVTEIGWNTRTAPVAGALVIDDHVQAQFLVRAYALLLSAGVERVYWYLFRDYNDDRMGLVREDAAATRKPGFSAMATMVRQLRGAEFVGRDPTPPDVYSICFRRPSGEEVRVLWSLQPRTLSVSGATGATDLLGRSLGSSRVLQLSASPIYVAGEVRGLPEANTIVIADSRRGFASEQGRNGWSYGGREGNAFMPLDRYDSDDWRSAWFNDLPYLIVTAKEQHPSVRDGAPVAAVRRWKSDRNAIVRVAGAFQGGQQGGDGVGVEVAVDGQRRVRKVLGGAEGGPVAQTFDFIETVRPGTTIDFAVDPGPAANIDHDGAAVSVTISMLKP